MPGSNDYLSLGAKKMSVHTSTSLDLEHKLAEESATLDMPNDLVADPQTSMNVKPDFENDENDPAKVRERLARLQADFENARKRSLKEQQEFKEYAVFDTVKALLPLLDSLQQAVQTPISDVADLHAGVELIHRQLQDILFRMGVSSIDAVGEHFDPRIHHAIATVDTDLVEDGTVVGELQCGYKFKERLVRPAMVTVARKIPPDVRR